MNHYFYIDIDGKQKGTYTPEELRNEHIRKETLVWTQGMTQWMRADEVAELQSLFAEQGYPATNTVQETTAAPAYQQPVNSNSEGGKESNNAPVMKVKDWIITYLIMLVPVVNIVFLFIWAFSEGNHNPNKVSWAKASLLWSAIILVLYFILFFVVLGAGLFSLSDFESGSNTFSF
ncbi:DUF4339 domain-containing protein [Seramator thermalis]|uniref:DUF4339 domain-containing protein n=1 Tax=Seramator thermalis TaxID=2496270 RepID=UPI00101D3464|nr:DUF4339 domain-containing protein [Seramator thermalis]